jgi:uncharacterized protein YndB with AHSA1/START domain
MAANDTGISDRDILIERIVAAPRELVWRAWTEADQIAAWWGPNGFTTTTHEMHVRVGGVWRFIMHGPDGTDYPNRIIYREIVKPERLVYDHDDDGEGQHAFRSTITFASMGDRTKVTLHAVFPTADARAAAVKFGAVEGGQQTLARLDQHLAAMSAGC